MKTWNFRPFPFAAHCWPAGPRVLPPGDATPGVLSQLGAHHGPPSAPPAAGARAGRPLCPRLPAVGRPRAGPGDGGGLARRDAAAGGHRGLARLHGGRLEHFQALPLLEANGMVASFHVPPQALGTAAHMSRLQLGLVEEAGHQVLRESEAGACTPDAGAGWCWTGSTPLARLAGAVTRAEGRGGATGAGGGVRPGGCRGLRDPRALPLVARAACPLGHARAARPALKRARRLPRRGPCAISAGVSAFPTP